MAGRINDDDVAAVREKSLIADVIGEHVQLRNAGGGNLKGICPFHDEKSPSLSVSPARGLYHCFGCGAGGDVIRFVQEIEHLGFTEAVEQLAGRAGIQLRYTDGNSTGARPVGQRARLVEAHTVAAAFYAEQLLTPDARVARDYLTERGFDSAVAARFGCGYAPSDWDRLTKHLLGRGFTPAELTLAGLARESGRGSLIDRFHRRLLWPIKDVSGDVVGFGARRLYDDDKIEAKYLNTPETPIYKKSQLLYGMDTAKREIAKQHRVVVVEGYTDVMACHLAGETTAVATCGTSFGSDHIGVLRRLLMDSDVFSGEVVFTFDGDAAGMKAAERAFGEDQKFMAQTFVAIEPSGKDPCEVRQSAGDAAVRSLIAGRVRLVDYVLRTVTRRHDLESAEGRVAALDQGVPLVAGIKDFALRDEYARRLAGLVGVDDPVRVVQRVRAFVRAAEHSSGAGAGRGSSGAPGQGRPDPGPGRHAAPANGASTGRPAGSGSAGTGGMPAPTYGASAPTPGVPAKVVETEREAVKAALQLPTVVGADFDRLGTAAFRLAVHQQLQQAIGAAGGASQATAGPGWVATVAEYLPPDSEARAAVNALAVEPLRQRPAAQPTYAVQIVLSLAVQGLERERATLMSRLLRLDNGSDADEAAALTKQLAELEHRRRELADRVRGDSD